jgi:hypothetical protein
MNSIKAIWGPMNSGFAYHLEFKGVSKAASQRRTSMAVVLFPRMPHEALEIELSDSQTDSAKLKADYLRHVIEIVVEGILTVLKVHFI